MVKIEHVIELRLSED